MQEQEYMRRAIELAKKGMGWTNPNPLVGAVIVKDGRIIGEGYHRRCGELHAERNAIASLTESAEGATIYVTLEPCCHYGKTPPCTEAIIEQKIARVVIGSRDPNPFVAGKGAQLLREHGIVVEEDFLREECDAINPVFFHYIVTQKPYVVMKYAMTLDGKIATHTGASKWITGEEARHHVHELRGHYAAIMAGIGTVLADDPMLNCRREGAHQPLRVIVDSNSFTPEDLTEIHPWLIKPNEQEIVSFLGTPVENAQDAANAAAELVKRGVAEEVMISLGGDGAVWSDGCNSLILSVPKLAHPVSTIGAGDSTLAGVLHATARGLDRETVLRTAVSFGTAACMTEGTLPPKAEDVKAVFGQTRVL